MQGTAYRVILLGGVLEQGDPTMLKKTLADLFRVNEEKMESLLSGPELVVKRGLNREQAGQILRTLHRAGGRCRAEADTPTERPEAFQPDERTKKSAHVASPLCGLQVARDLKRPFPNREPRSEKKEGPLGVRDLFRRKLAAIYLKITANGW